MFQSQIKFLASIRKNIFNQRNNVKIFLTLKKMCLNIIYLFKCRFFLCEATFFWFNDKDKHSPGWKKLCCPILWISLGFLVGQIQNLFFSNSADLCGRESLCAGATVASVKCIWTLMKKCSSAVTVLAVRTSRVISHIVPLTGWVWQRQNAGNIGCIKKLSDCKLNCKTDS